MAAQRAPDRIQLQVSLWNQDSAQTRGFAQQRPVAIHPRIPFTIPLPPSSTLLGIRSNFIGPFGDAGKQSQTNADGFARSFTTFKHNIFLGDQMRNRNIRIKKLQACVTCVWIPESVTVNVSIIISSDQRCLYRILVGIIETPGLENL